jgi:RecJ-like exonuclease
MRKACPNCDGLGLVGKTLGEDCPECKGSGMVTAELPQRHCQPKFPDTEDGRLVEQLCELESLSDWEIGFVESLATQVQEGRSLSGPQRDKGQQILQERS